MKSFSSSLLVAAVIAASMASSSVVDAFSLSPRGGIARNPYVSVARRVALSDPNTSTDIDVTESPSDVAVDLTDSPSDAAVDAASEDVAVDAAAEDAAPVRHTVYVGNLPFTTTSDAVREMFEKIVIVKDVSLPTKPNVVDEVTGMPISKGFAFVDVEREEDIEKAIAALNEIEIEGRSIRVSKILPKEEVKREKRNFSPEGQQKLYVGNLPYDVNREEIEEYFGRFGTILDLYIPLKDGRCRGFAFVTLDEAAANEAIKEADGAEFLGRPLVVNVPQPKGEERWSGERLPRRPSPRSQDNSRNKFKMYIGNLSFYTTKDVLTGVFEEFGKVYDCYLPTDPNTDKPRGYAFITMEREAGQEAISELDGLEIDGRFIRVSESQAKKPSRRNYSNDDDGDDF